ncbi:MAG: FecR domain-containing protein [Methylococcales bacterium]|nr:FecR domain-containing protein [Methylococcales bacterium]
MIKINFLPFLLLLFFCILQVGYAQDIIGHVSFVRGSVAAILNENAPRLLGKDSPIFQAEYIQTSAQSFVIINFKDGSKITIRPDSRFSINEYSLKQEKRIAKMTLHKGGVRVNNNAKSSNKFEIKTPIKIINTEQSSYSIRLCKQDCEKKKPESNHKKATSIDLVAARVVKMAGKVSVKNTEKKNKQWQLRMGAALYEGDYLTSDANSYVVLAFRDGGRVTIQEKTEYKINSYQYNTSQEKSIQTLIKGGLRILTGKIGKIKKDDYRLNTPVATIGIRGTGFDLYCAGNCRNEGKKLDLKNGLFAQVWQGSIHQKNKHSQVILKRPKVSYIANDTSAILMLPKLPSYIRQTFAIRPDKVDIEDDLFKSSLSVKEPPEGLYIAIHSGTIQLSELGLTFKKDEYVYVNASGHVLQIEKQAFQVEDNYPLPSAFDEKKAEVGDYSLLRNNYRDQGAPVYECVVE